MALTEEQRKRMEDNRKRALEIKRKRQLEIEQNEKKERGSTSTDNDTSNVFEAGGFVVGGTKKSSGEGKEDKNDEARTKKQRIKESKEDGRGGYVKGGNAISISNGNIGNTNTVDIDGDGDEYSLELEDFEINASSYISQTEAQRTYCIPMGTLEVCSYIEKDNPHKRGWSKMKLYSRSEVRQRGRKRFGGKQGLIEEREKRKLKRLDSDLKETRDVFR